MTQLLEAISLQIYYKSNGARSREPNTMIAGVPLLRQLILENGLTPAHEAAVRRVRRQHQAHLHHIPRLELTYELLFPELGVVHHDRLLQHWEQRLGTKLWNQERRQHSTAVGTRNRLLLELRLAVSSFGAVQTADLKSSLKAARSLVLEPFSSIQASLLGHATVEKDAMEHLSKPQQWALNVVVLTIMTQKF